jgi:small subunit ribosomal protein S18
LQNFSLISEFTRSSGQILPAQETRLRPVNQRKIAKMIRRAQGMGIFPSVHHHPEVIKEHFYPSWK